MSDIILKVDHNVTYIEGTLNRDVYSRLRTSLGYRSEDAQWMIKKSTNKPWMKDWDGIITTLCKSKRWCKCFVKKDGAHFSTGLLSKAKAVFDAKRVTYKIVDIRDKSEDKIQYDINKDEFEFRDYQLKVIDKAIDQERGLIKAATGSGKSAIAAGIIAGLGKAPFVFYVTSKDLLRQAHDELERFILGNGLSLEVGMVGGGHKEIQDVTVMTVQTAVRALGAKYKKYDEEDNEKDKTDVDDVKEDIKALIKNARGIIADEVQHWQCAVCQIISDASESAQYRYGLSATPYRDMGDDILIDACFGRCIADISASFLIKEGYLIKPEIFFIPVKNMRGFKKSNYQEIYKHAIVENTLRNTHISKIAQTMRDQGRIILILCKHIAHGNMLHQLIPDSVFLHGSVVAKKRKEHLDKMRKREASITIASTIFDEGIDVRPLDTLILAGSEKSSTRALQRVGRILRPYKNKNTALVVDFEDHCRYMLGHSKKRRKIYQTEPEFVINDLDMK